MANRLFSPDEQYSDQNGIPYAGGFLFFFASGTSTPLNTYSNQSLTIPNSNPIMLDSAGRQGSIFLQNLAYKVVLEDANGNQIWTEDPVYSSDFSTVAQFSTFPGNPNGNVAGTAGSGTVPSSVVWDSVDKILYVATQTGNVITTVWTAVNASTAASVVPYPQGYLTPTSATPIIPTDVTSATAILYTPYVGNIIPIWNGASFTPTVFTELTCNLTSGQQASTLYDMFVFNNSGVVTLVTGPAWSNSTPGTCTRGTGAGTTQLLNINGLWVNAVSMSGKNSTNTYTIGANVATYVGTIFIDGTAGQITFNRSWGQSRKWAAWNAYNRIPIIVQAGDNTTNWTYGAGFRPSHGSTANSITILCGLPEEQVTNGFVQVMDSVSGGNNSRPQIGIGWNSTSAPSGFQTSVFAFTTTIGIEASVFAQYLAPPFLGLTTVTALEASAAGSNNSQFYGTQASMVLSCTWRG